MTFIEKANTTDPKKTCLKCGSHAIQNINWGGDPPYDWRCLICDTYQLTYLKQKGFRQYAFLLSGSWTSSYIYARSLKEAYKRAKKLYQGTHEVYRSYLCGATDAFTMKGWLHF